MTSVNGLFSPPKGRRTRRAHLSALTVVALITLLVLGTSTVQGALPKGAPQAPEGPPPGWNIVTVDSKPKFANMTGRSLAYRSDGAPCIAYGGDHLYYSCYKFSTDKWTTEIVDGDPRVGEYASLAFHKHLPPSEDTYPVISYYDAANGRLKLALNIGSGWDIRVVPAPPAPPVLPPPSSPDLPDEPLEDEDQSRSSVDESRFELKPWLAPVYKSSLEGLPPLLPADPPGYGKFASLTIDSKGRIHLSYYDETHGRGTLVHTLWDTGMVWATEVVDWYPAQTTGDVGLWTSIKVDGDDNVHISYMTDKYDALKYVFGQFRQPNPPDVVDYEWHISEVESRENVTGKYTSLGLVYDDDYDVWVPHIVYMDWGNYNLKHAWRVRQGWPWNKEKVDGAAGGNVGWFTSMIVSGSKLYVSYYDAGNKRVKYATMDGNGNWTITGAVYDRVDYFTSLGFKSGGVPTIAYYDTDSGELRFIIRGYSTWSLKKEINTAGDVGLSSSLDLNSDGVPFISYFDIERGRLKYARAYGTAWSTDTVANLYAGHFSSLKLRNETKARIAFYDFGIGGLREANRKSGAWDIDIVDRSYNVGEFVSMALDSNKAPHISYHDATHRDLLYAYWDVTETEWMTDTLDKEGVDIGLYTSIAIDSLDNPHISYYDDSIGALKYIYRTKYAVWSIPAVVDNYPPPDQVGLYTSIALDNVGGDDIPHISYYDQKNEALKYAYWTGATWKTFVVDNSGAVGMYTSLGVDQSDHSRHICYYDSTNGDLKYAEWTGGDDTNWTILTMDGDLGDDVGVTCSIALTSNLDRVGISYYDFSLGDLKYAYNYGPPPDYPLPPAKTFIPLVIK